MTKGISKSTTMFVVGLCLGIVLGIGFQMMLLSVSINSFVNNILPKIEIKNIEFNLNETALMEAMNNTFGDLKEAEE